MGEPIVPRTWLLWGVRLTVLAAATLRVVLAAHLTLRTSTTTARGDTVRQAAKLMAAWCPLRNRKTLYVTNDLANSLTPINPSPAAPRDSTSPSRTPTTCRRGRRSPPNALDFRDHILCSIQKGTALCTGVDHLDFSRSRQLRDRNG